MCKIIKLYENLNVLLPIHIENGLLELDTAHPLPATYKDVELIKVLYYTYLSYRHQRTISVPMLLEGDILSKIKKSIHNINMFGRALYGHNIVRFAYDSGVLTFN